MNKKLIKICGNVFLEESLKVAKFNPDYMGWIFVESSPRKILLNNIKSIIEEIKISYPNIKHVAVLSENEITLIEKIIKSNLFQVIQLILTQDLFIQISNKYKNYNIEFLPVIRVSNKIQNEDLKKYKNNTFFIFDTFKKNKLGGTGETFDLNLISEVNYTFLLAGGIKSDNIKNILEKLNKHTNLQSYMRGIDISSGVEVENQPGFKDEEKLFKIFEIINSNF